MTATKALPRKPARREPVLPLPRCPAISLTRQARAHVLAQRQAAGQGLWCDRDLFIRLWHKGGLPVEPAPGKEQYGHVCLPLDMPT